MSPTDAQHVRSDEECACDIQMIKKKIALQNMGKSKWGEYLCKALYESLFSEQTPGNSQYAHFSLLSVFLLN